MIPPDRWCVCGDHMREVFRMYIRPLPEPPVVEYTDYCGVCSDKMEKGEEIDRFIAGSGLDGIRRENPAA